MLFVWDGGTKNGPLEADILSSCDASIGESAGGMVDAVKVELDWVLASLIDDDTESSGGGSKMGDVSWCIFGDDFWGFEAALTFSKLLYPFQIQRI